MSYQIVSSHITHGKTYSSFYEIDHENDDLPFIPVGEPLTRRAVLQGNTPGNVIQGLKPLYSHGGIN